MILQQTIRRTSTPAEERVGRRPYSGAVRAHAPKPFAPNNELGISCLLSFPTMAPYCVEDVIRDNLVS